MTAGDFFERIDELSRAVGSGHLVAKVEVDQIYAHYQEVGDEFKHPRGGRARALRDSLYEPIDSQLETLAARAVTPDGSQLRDAMIDVAEKIGDTYHGYAPVEFGYLRASDHPTVTDEGAVVYDRPPAVARLSEEELKREHKVKLWGPL